MFDPTLEIDHQLDLDSAGGVEGRKEARRLNSGLMASLVPHQFYRKRPPATIPENPKVSIVLYDVPVGAVEATWKLLLAQPRTDFELVVVANPDDHDPFAGATVGDRRIRFSPSLEDATSSATSEYVCYLNGHGAPSDVLFSEMIKRLDQRPEYVTATTGYALPSNQGGAARTQNGAAAVDSGWQSDMPLCWFIRKREATKLMREGAKVADVWRATREWDMNRHWPSAAVRLPGLEKAERPVDFTNVPPDPLRLAKDLVKKPRDSVSTMSRVSWQPDETGPPTHPCPRRPRRPAHRLIAPRPAMSGGRVGSTSATTSWWIGSESCSTGQTSPSREIPKT